MAEHLTLEEGDDGNLWVVSLLGGVAVAVCFFEEGAWWVAEDDGRYNPAGPFADLDTLLNEVEAKKLFQPWGSPAN